MAPSIALVLRKPLPVEEMIAVAEHYGRHPAPSDPLSSRQKKGGDTREEEGAAA